MARVSLQPHFEPIGVSPEVHRSSRRWLVVAILAGAVLVAGLVIALWWTENLALPR